jgi:hypothetical protein
MGLCWRWAGLIRGLLCYHKNDLLKVIRLLDYFDRKSPTCAYLRTPFQRAHFLTPTKAVSEHSDLICEISLI